MTHRSLLGAVLWAAPLLCLACASPSSDAHTSKELGALPDGGGEVLDANAPHDGPSVDAAHTLPPLSFGFGTAPLFAPLGISTAGYGQTPPKTAPTGPLATSFQATTTLLHAPRAQALYLRSPTARLLLIQTDLIGIHQRFFALVADRLEAEIPGFSREHLILAANHTHSGPGHIFDAFFANTVVDAFIAEIAGRIADAIVKAAKRATADAEGADEADVGYALLSNAEMHNDRRCENAKHQNDRMAVLVVRDKGDPKRSVTVVNYAMHGTVFSAEDGMLSGDAPRAVERALEISTGGPVLFMQSWAGDMSPGHPAHLYTHGTATNAPLPDLDRLESLGRSAQLTLTGLAAKLTWLQNPDLAVHSREFEIDHEILAYQPGEFDEPNGAILCGFGKSGCKPETPVDMKTCISLPQGGGPAQIRMTTARIGPIALVTLPGEPVTTLGESVMQRVEKDTSANVAFVLGYAQDYTGYLLFSEDWAAGGYEASFNYWGPKQGAFVADAAVAVTKELFDAVPVQQQVRPPLVYSMKPGPLYQPIEAIDGGEIVTQVYPVISVGDVVTLALNGAKDPWFGSPEVRLFDAQGEEVPAQLGIIRRLTVSPSFRDKPVSYGEKGSARTFTWTISLRTQLRTPGLFQLKPGSYRLRVRLPGRSAPVTSALFKLQ